ncbi:SIMPL domain-containing protein [Mycobacterium sp. MBM]|nr:SIMPL domain-containing protein [Mycobacterium sp. MBM]
MPTEITVRGTFSAFQPPERGTVRASISYEGAEMGTVYDRVAHDLAVVKDSITRLQSGEPAPITWWSAEQLRTWSRRPWHKDGKQLPMVHHASVGVEVKFRDFAALSRWVGEHVSGTAGFRVTQVLWALTAARREMLVVDARTRAVRDAAARAQQYADALQLGAVRPVAIADAGMLGVQPLAGAGTGGTFLRAAATGAGGGEIELAPEDIEVSATIDARFVAGD